MRCARQGGPRTLYRHNPWLCVSEKRSYLQRFLIVKSQQNRIVWVIRPDWLASSWQSSSHWPSSYAAVAVPSTPSGRCSHKNGFLQKVSLNWWFRVRVNLRRLLKTENYHFLYTPCLVSSLNSKKCSFSTMFSSQEKFFLHNILKLTSIIRCHSSLYFTFSLSKTWVDKTIDPFIFTWTLMSAKSQDLPDHRRPTLKLKYLLGGYRYQ